MRVLALRQATLLLCIVERKKKRVVLRSLSTLVHPWLLVLLSLACHMLLPAQLLFWHPLLRRVLHLLNLALFTLGH